MANARRAPEPPSPGPVESTEESLPTVYLKPGDADRVLAGHPWIYEGNILRLTREPADGAVIQVKDHRRRFLGVGFYNSKSRIRVRVLSDQRRDIDAAFLEQRLRAAIEHRRRFMPGASSCRLVNAEGDLLSGLVVDKYEDVLVLQTSSVGMDQRKTAIAEILNRLLAPRAILERNDMPSRKFEGLPETHGVLAGTLSEADQAAVPVLMNGLRFEANLAAGHKTGLYLDQQLNHLRVAALTRGARVLDAFCFLGGFGLHAARAGASSVLGIDQSAEAVQTAQRIAASNGLAETCRFEAANVFDWLRTATATTATATTATATTATATTAPAPATGPAGSSQPSPSPESLYDVVILDPPSFTRNRASVPDALRGYKEIHLRALKLLRPGGILATFCCSHHVDAATFEAVVLEASLDARRLLRRIESYGQSPDHPIIPTIPESEYLKGFAYEAIAP